MKPKDVPIEVMDEALAKILRKKSHAERLAIGFGLWSAARRMLIGSLKMHHPEWGDEQIQREVARRFSAGEMEAYIYIPKPPVASGGRA